MSRPLTPPGGLAPAPGSAPGSGAFPEDETPTKPDNSVQPELLRLVRLVDSMPAVERRRFLSMCDHYGRMPLGRRVLLEELARELARGKTV